MTNALNSLAMTHAFGAETTAEGNGDRLPEARQQSLSSKNSKTPFFFASGTDARLGIVFDAISSFPETPLDSATAKWLKSAILRGQLSLFQRWMELENWPASNVRCREFNRSGQVA